MEVNEGGGSHPPASIKRPRPTDEGGGVGAGRSDCGDERDAYLPYYKPDYKRLYPENSTNTDFKVYVESTNDERLGNKSLISSCNPVNKNDGVLVYYKNCITGISIEEPSVAEASVLLIKLNIDTAILGDINIDITPENLNQEAEDYLNMLVFHGLLPTHTFPTRFPSSTCLDHGILKSPLTALTLVINSSITDHSSVVMSLDIKNRYSAPTRSIKKVDHDSLSQSLLNTDFSSVLNNTDCEEATNNLIEILQSVISMHTSVMTRSHRTKIIKPWMTPGLLKCIRNRDRMHYKLKKQPENDILRKTYYRYRNFCNSLLKKLKKNYEKGLLLNAGTNTKKLWTAIKDVSNLNKKHDRPSDLLKCRAIPKDSTNHVNSHFVGIGKALALNIQSNHQHDSPPPLRPNPPFPLQSLVMLDTSIEEVEITINSLKESCAAGWDNITSAILKRNLKILATPIAHVCNLSMRTGIFPSAFKKAIVHPIFKSGNRGSVDNYRPISILSALSKILERLINKRLVSYLEDKQLLSPNQFGFRAKRSSSDAIHELTDHIVRNLDSHRKCLGIFLDLAKAFDTVSAQILLQKLEALGVRGVQLSLFKSYLSGRSQCVVIDGHVSSYLPVEFGVPQGSILGPTLFLVYMNDLCSLKIPNSKLVSYADDTALVFSAKSWREAFSYAQTGFDIVSCWLRQNLLTLNIEKTCYLTFSIYTPPIALIPYSLTAHTHSSVPSVPCSCATLKRGCTVKYLGITLDSRLTFQAHLMNMCGRVRKLMFIFKKIRHVAEPHIVRMMYLALCQSVLLYAITTWGGAAKTHLLSLERAQRALLKVCLFKPILFPTFTLYQEAQMLTVRQLFILNTALKQHHEHKPSPSSSRSARRPPPVHLPSLYTAFSHRFYCYLGPFIYNKLIRKLNIHLLLSFSCKKKVTAYIQGLNYDETENLIQPMV
ncbi:unnamed protein product [Pieris macdunnoughi]|uniref:Reverse transcriptase domain-containing protein n=1 Tax=Pieris macdunnoughi TaxID=345717 RepID=A0A821XVI5_9NEOP|nr:unnamed protein product [Pieris macdunnoughi]